MNYFDIIIIGSGPGGYTAAVELAKHGKSVAVIEKDEIGGVCLNTGCIPTKTIIESARLYSKTKSSETFGITTENTSYDWPKILQRKDKVIFKLRKGIEYLFKINKVTFIKGTATIKEPGIVTVDNTDVIKCSNIIIATGSRTKAIKGFENALTSEQLLSITAVPKKLTIIGAGPIGIEFASIFSSFGTEVTVYEMENSILPSEDEDISKAAKQIFSRRGINIIAGNKVDPSEVDISNCLVSSGRQTDMIIVNSRMQTNEKGIYAIGDATGILNYAHVASMQGIIAAKSICGTDIIMDYSAVPSCVFSDPEIASVGLTEKQAQEKGINYKTSKYNFAALGKSNASSEIEGFVKVIADKETDKLIGCHIIGSNASNLIGEAALAIKNGLTSKNIAETIHSHPTLPEAFWEACSF